ncbi:DUF4236 domain-containing protein [Bradyrhizobium sp. 141]|nr:DUF4236 domain-containing protein [Bradyrhizobium sp. 141]
MGLRFRKSIKLIPGVRLNIGLRRSSLLAERASPTTSAQAVPHD